MTTAQEPATILKCRYRYATGCDATYGSKPGLYQHEKSAAARQELDARQVKELFDARAQAASPPPVLMPFPPPGPQASAVPSPNGHPAASNGHATPAPAPDGTIPLPLDLPAVQDAFAALIAEVEALRAENTALKAEAATFARIRAMLAGQDAGQP